MKRICFITDSIFKSGGMQRVTAVIAEELSKQYDVTIVSFEEPEQEDLSMYGLKDYPVKIVFTHFRKTEKWKSMLYNAYSYLYKNALPKTAITSDLYAHSSFPREMREAVVKILKEGQFDTIIAVNSYLSMRLATIKRDLGGVKAIGWIYNSFNAFLREASPYLGTELKYHYGRQLQKLDETVLLYLQDSEMYYHAYGFSPFVIPNPLTLKPGAPSTGKNKRFLAVGRLTPKHKGFDLLIKAFDKFAQRNSDWYLDIVGDGPEKEALNKMIEKFELGELLNTHPYDLSGGEQEKLGIVKVLSTNPDILLLDEPTKGLDIFLKKDFAKLFENLKRDGKTIIVVTHDIEFCKRVADRCGLFAQGEIIGINKTEEFFKNMKFYT